MLSKQEQLANPFPAGSKKLNLTYKAIKMLKLANIWIIKENPLPVGQENPNSRAETWFTQCVAHHRPQLGNLFSLVCRDNKRAKLQTHYKICLIRLGFLFGTVKVFLIGKVCKDKAEKFMVWNWPLVCRGLCWIVVLTRLHFVFFYHKKDCCLRRIFFMFQKYKIIYIAFLYFTKYSEEAAVA